MPADDTPGSAVRMPLKLYLLLYVPRSGSTFFADLVARNFAEILVLPELRLPRLLVDAEFSSPPGRKQLLDLVDRDHQFAELGISRGELELCIDSMGEFDAGEFLRRIAGLYADRQGRAPRAVLYKCGSAGRRWQGLRDRLPNVGLIHVYRDARAAVNSAMHAERPYHPGQRMGRGDPWFRARGWDRFMDNMDRLRDSGAALIEFGYEELCRQPDAVLQALGRELGLEPGAVDGLSSAVAAAETAIHQRVGSAPAAERIDAWQDEMPAWQGLLVERLAARQLAKRGYAPYYRPRSHAPGSLAALVYGFLYHLVATCYFHARRRLLGQSAPQRGH